VELTSCGCGRGPLFSTFYERAGKDRRLTPPFPFPPDPEQAPVRYVSTVGELPIFYLSTFGCFSHFCFLLPQHVHLMAKNVNIDDWLIKFEDLKQAVKHRLERLKRRVIH
jgi:hypothetical protein